MEISGEKNDKAYGYYYFNRNWNNFIGDEDILILKIV